MTEDSLLPVAPGIFGYSDEDQLPYLCGGRCKTCGSYFFPCPDGCSRCQGEVESVNLGRHGVIYAHTVIRTRPPYGLPRPYAVALVDLEDVPLRLFCLLDPAHIGDFGIGTPVELAIAAMGHDGQERPCLRPLFTLRP